MDYLDLWQPGFRSRQRTETAMVALTNDLWQDLGDGKPLSGFCQTQHPFMVVLLLPDWKVLDGCHVKEWLGPWVLYWIPQYSSLSFILFNICMEPLGEVSAGLEWIIISMQIISSCVFPTLGQPNWCVWVCMQQKPRLNIWMLLATGREGTGSDSTLAWQNGY